MGKVWGFHMPEWVGDDPIEQGYVRLGWSRIGDVFKLPPDRNAYKDAVRQAYPEKKERAIPVDAGTLFRFAHEVEAGDTIIYPSKHNRMINIGQATGARWHRADGSSSADDYPNYLGVKWLKHLPRSDFSQAALNEIGSFITLFSVTTHADDFQKHIESGIERPTDDVTTSKLAGPADFASGVLDLPDDQEAHRVSQSAIENTEDFVIRRIKNGLSGHEFEHFIANLMECLGYKSRVTEKSGDGGVDVIAHTDELGFQPPIIKIQCKLQTGQIGEPDVSQLLGTLGEGEFALFVTLGSYTRQARMRERSTPRLRLLDGEDVVGLVLERYQSLAANYRALIPLKQIYVPDPRHE